MTTQSADNDALLSRLLFEARERSEMFADIVESQTGKRDDWGRRLVSEIDEYRASRGWSPHGFGGESDTPPGTSKGDERERREPTNGSVGTRLTTSGEGQER